MYVRWRYDDWEILLTDFVSMLEFIVSVIIFASADRLVTVYASGRNMESHVSFYFRNGSSKSDRTNYANCVCRFSKINVRFSYRQALYITSLTSLELNIKY